MADLILEMSKSAVTRKIISTLRLPIPMPPRLERASGAWPHQPLSGRTVILGASGGKGLIAPALETLHSMGADVAAIAGADNAALLAAASALGCALQTHTDAEDAPKVHALVFDATEIADVAGLRGLYDFFHARAGKIAGSGRSVILARPHPARHKSPGR